MYAHWVSFTLGPGTRSTAEGIARQFGPILRGLKGFKGVTFLGDDALGEYCSLTLWESMADLQAATAATEPQLRAAISGIAKGPPSDRTFEVFEA